MSKALTGKRSRNFFDPQSDKPFRLSRSKLERFRQCPRCFYLDRRLGVDRPDMPGWTLNSAVDALLKNEFDIYRDRGQAHPIMQENNLGLVPYQSEQLNEWRKNAVGVRFHHAETNLIVSGAVDDVWVNPDDTLYVVDYKSTSTVQVISFDGNSRRQYKRQMEIYQWLLRQNGFTVSDTGYFVYANASRNRPSFDQRLEFDLTLFAYTGNSGWVEPCVIGAHRCLSADQPPDPAPTCSYCLYRKAADQVEQLLPE
jgi:hypothetical protein